MKRFQEYLQNNPLPAWLFSSGLALLFNLALLWLLPINKENPVFVLLIIILSLSSPTWLLVDRFSGERRRLQPIPPRQEQAVGILALLAGASSIGAFLLFAFGRELGVPLPPETGIWLLTLFSGSALLSLTLGYVARHTREGHRAMVLTAGWVALLILLAFVFFVASVCVKVLLPRWPGR